ncbi:MAG TPA: hypothetical protein VEG34_04750 [Thermoanaerobaculia bacterium]|nr:hypothetical protein [Thermoanaerobaculia bacterium]
MTTQRDDDENVPGKTWGLLRILLDWSKKDVGRATRLGQSQIADYEGGRVYPRPPSRTRLLGAFALPPEIVDAAAELAAAAEVSTPSRPVTLDGLARSGAACEIAELMAERLPRRRTGEPSAQSLVELLVRRKARERKLLARVDRVFHRPDVLELLCRESLAATARDAGKAAELAELGVIVAGRLPELSARRARLVGAAWVLRANALRVQGHLGRAKAAYRAAARFWRKGEGAADAALIDDVWFLSLRASLQRERRHPAGALELLEHSLALTPEGPVRGLLLISKGKTLEALGDPGAALACLEEAERFVDGELFPRHLFALRFNVLICLDLLGRSPEAEPLLPEVRQLAARLGTELDAIRLRWLEGRLAFGCGRAEEGIAALQEVRAAFASRRISYDTALVTLELADFQVQHGDDRAACRLAAEAYSIFEMPGAGQEVRKAVCDFIEATERGALSPELLRRLTRALQAGPRPDEAPAG